MEGDLAKQINKAEGFIKIAVIGPSASGKTELCNRFAKKDFSGSAPASIGINLNISTFGQDGKEFTVLIWDTAGRDRVFESNKQFLNAANGIVFVYDITDENSFDQTKKWIELLQTELNSCEMIVVGNKCDQADRRNVSTLRGYKLAFEHGATFYEVSAKTNANVQDAFNTLLRHAIARIDGKKVTVPEEIVQDPYALILYEKALKEGREKDASIRVNIVGNSRQGKTTLMRRLMRQKIKRIISTDGIAVEHYRCERSKDGKLHFHKSDDIDTSHLVQRLISVAVREDITCDEQQTQSPRGEAMPESNYDRNSEVDEDLSVHTHSGYFQDNLNKDTVFISVKKNKANEEVLNKVAVLSPEEKNLFVNALKTNQKSSQPEKMNVFDIWDFGGQYIFYATHTIFHSNRAIYLLVFDLSVNLNEYINDEQYPSESENRNMKYFIQFWISSIHSFVGSADGSSPKIILVGTHKDKLKGKKQEKEQYIKKYFDDIRQMFDGTNLSRHIYIDDFAVDNTDAKDPSMKSLRETIIRIGDEQSETFEIPLKWIQLEKSLLERKHLKLISVKFVLFIDLQNEFPLGDVEQVKLFLRYHHAKGTLVYFDEEPISQYVVLDPQYLIDAFKCIITSERFCTNDPEIRPLWKLLLTEGRLEKALIDRQWRKPTDTFEMFEENEEILLSFLVKHHIISEAAVFDENTHKSTGLGWFVVPSLLKDHSSTTEIKDFLHGKNRTKVRYVIVFDCTPIVPTIYHRVVSATIGKWPIAKIVNTAFIFKSMCIVRLSVDHAGIAEMKHNSIEMTVVNLSLSSDVNGEHVDSFRRFLEAVIANEFCKLRRTEEMHTKPYTVWFRCNHESHGENGSENLIAIADVRGEKTVPCPDLLTHEINVDQAEYEWFQDNRNIKRIPNKPITDKLLSSISQCIGNNWQLLGLELGLTQVQIDHIFEDYPRSAVMRIYIMLQNWCRQDANRATLNLPVETMQRCPHINLDWDKLRNIIDELNKLLT